MFIQSLCSAAKVNDKNDIFSSIYKKIYEDFEKIYSGNMGSSASSSIMNTSGLADKR